MKTNLQTAIMILRKNDQVLRRRQQLATQRWQGLHQQYLRYLRNLRQKVATSIVTGLDVHLGRANYHNYLTEAQVDTRQVR